METKIQENKKFYIKSLIERENSELYLSTDPKGIANSFKKVVSK
jgi:hypothetical protein